MNWRVSVLYTFHYYGLASSYALIFTGLVGYVLKPEKKKPEVELIGELKNIRSKLDELTREVEVIKKAIEE